MIHREKVKKFIPVQGLVVFKRGKGEFYVQTHEILEDGKSFTWAEGKPFAKEQLAELAQAISAKNITAIILDGLLPTNVLLYQTALTGTKTIWYLPPGQRYLTIKHMKAGNCKLPGLIFAIADKTLYVLAYKGKRKPCGTTQIFKAPFFNISSNGIVCMGTTSETTKKIFLKDEMNRWERRFFGSRFTHVSDDSVIAKGFTIEKLFRSLLAKKRFPEKCLVPSSYKNLAAFAHSLMKGGNRD